MKCAMAAKMSCDSFKFMTTAYSVTTALYEHMTAAYSECITYLKGTLHIEQGRPFYLFLGNQRCGSRSILEGSRNRVEEAEMEASSIGSRISRNIMLYWTSIL